MIRSPLLFFMLIVSICLCAQSIDETLAQIEATKRELADNERIVEQKIADLRASNPLFAPQDPFESDFEYMGRLSQALPQLERIRKQYLDDVWQRLNKLRARTFETTSIEVIFGKYEPNSQIWDISVLHKQFQKESIDLEIYVERATAKAINDNKARLIIKGTLTIDLGDKIGLAKLLVRDPVTGFEITHDFHPIQKFKGTNIAFSPNGKYIACDGVIVYDVSTGLEFSIGGGTKPAFSQDSRYLATAKGRIVMIFDLEARQMAAEFEHPETIKSVSFSPDGKFLALDCYGKAVIINLETHQQIVEFEHGYGIKSLDISPNGKYLAFGGGCSYGPSIFNIETCQRIVDPGRVQYHTVTSVSFSPDGKFIAKCSGDYDFTTSIYDLTTNEYISSYDFGKQVAWSPFINYLAVSGSGKTQIMNIDAGTKHYQYNVEGSLAFSTDGRFLAIGDAIYRTYITAEGMKVEKGISHPPILAAKLSFTEPSGNNYLDATEKGTLQINVNNTGQGAAANIIIKLEPAKIAGLNYLNGFIAEIPANRSVDIDIPIEAYIDVADGTHSLNITFEEANGFPPAPISFTFSTRAYKRPEIQIAEAGIEDSNQNGRIDVGEMIELTIRFRNRGAGPSNATYAKFYTGENVFITEKHSKTQSLGDLNPKASKDLKLEIFINDRCASEIPLYVDITEATGMAGATKLRVPISKSDLSRPATSLVVTGTDQASEVTEPISLNIDVEMDIPASASDRKDDFAVIFGVESYSGNVPRVLYATRDATWFREYAIKTLGIPAANIYYRVNSDATKSEFDKAFGRNGWLDKRAKANSRVFFFFSGHGIPAQDKKSSYILPFDGDPNYADLTAYPLESVYTGLAGLKSALNVVFLDACFTGMNRENQALYATSRPVYISANKIEAPPRVNVFSAAAWDQMSTAWPDKQHGLFTYFLLKGMQGSADANADKKLSIQELHQYLSSAVPDQAGRLDKEQTPQLSSGQQDEVFLEYK